MVLRVFIVDDEPPARNRLRELLEDCNEQLPLEVVGEAANGQEALDKLMHTVADVVLVDIRMPQMDGIELVQHLNTLPRPVLHPSPQGDNQEIVDKHRASISKWPPSIIFTTAYDTYAIKAFDLHAIDYLLKPIRSQRLLEALNRARNAIPIRNDVLRSVMPEARKFLSIHERGHIYLVPIEEVLFLRAELKYVTVRTAKREYLIDESLIALEKEFSARFVRIHRNCLVSKEAIAGFERVCDYDAESDGWQVKLKGLDEHLAISRRQQHIIKELS